MSNIAVIDDTRPLQAMVKRKKCNAKCALFYECPLMVLAIQAPHSERVCLMRIMGPAIRRRFVKMFAGGEDGLIEEMKKILFIYSQDIERMPPSKQAEYFEMLIKLYKAIYGDKRVHISKPKPIEIQLEEVDGRYVSKEIIIDGVMRGSNSIGKLTEAARDNIEEINPENDPESLINSPMIDELIGIHPTWTEDMKGRPKGVSWEEQGRTEYTNKKRCEP